MEKILVYPVGSTAALSHAASLLEKREIALVDHPTPEVTHLLLDVPSFRPDGLLRTGMEPERILERLPSDITVVGGNLQQPCLSGYKTIDFLQDAEYLAKNARITADCALRVAAPLLKATFQDTACLILGGGRIGKCLGQLLRGLGCEPIIAVRKESDRALLSALGYRVTDYPSLGHILPRMQLLFNTVPAVVLDPGALEKCCGCVKIELASQAGLDGPDVVQARGLPGVYAPQSSGKLIADRFMKLYKEVTL